MHNAKKPKFNRRPIYFKLFKVLVVLSITLIFYFVYQKDVHLWLCENEKNGPSCYVYASLHEEEAMKYYKVSCQLKYEKACEKLETE